MIDYFSHCKKLLQQGDIRAAREWLRQEKDNLDHLPLYSYLKATTAEGDHLNKFEAAISVLVAEPPSLPLLHAHCHAAQWAAEGGDMTKSRFHLQAAAKSAGLLGEINKALCLEAAWINRLILDGLESEAFEALLAHYPRAIDHKADLLLISQGILLTSLLARRKRWAEAAHVAVTIEEAAMRRNNWLGFATSRMIRANQWRNMGKIQQSVRLLFDTGNKLYDSGAVVALNLIRARLTELRHQMGEKEFDGVVAESIK